MFYSCSHTAGTIFKQEVPERGSDFVSWWRPLFYCNSSDIVLPFLMQMIWFLTYKSIVALHRITVSILYLFQTALKVPEASAHAQNNWSCALVKILRHVCAVIWDNWPRVRNKTACSIRGSGTLRSEKNKHQHNQQLNKLCGCSSKRMKDRV